MIIILQFIHTRKASARRWICHVDSKSNRAHYRHGYDIKPGSLEPLSKGWPAVVRRSCIVRTAVLGVLATEHALLLLVVSTGSGGSVSRDRRRVALVEETHFKCWYECGMEM